MFHVRVLGCGVYAPVCLVCLHNLLYHYCVYFNCQSEDRKQNRAGRKLNLRKEEDMRSTVREVKDGQLKLRVAARAYNLPLGSYQMRVMCVKGTVPNTGHCSGRKTALSARDEQALTNHCLLIARTSWTTFES